MEQIGGAHHIDREQPARILDGAVRRIGLGGAGDGSDGGGVDDTADPRGLGRRRPTVGLEHVGLVIVEAVADRREEALGGLVGRR